MTIQEYLTELEKMPSYTGKNGATLKDSLLNSVSVWDNDACKGYCIKALQLAECTPEQIADILQKLTAAFDALTVSEAAELYARS